MITQLNEIEKITVEMGLYSHFCMDIASMKITRYYSQEVEKRNSLHPSCIVCLESCIKMNPSMLLVAPY